MGTICSHLFISLDGVVESPETFNGPYFNEQMGAGMGRMMASTEAFLMGRVLYSQWSEFWPGLPAGSDPFATFINEIPKYVVSNTVTGPTWNRTTVLSGDVTAQVRELKERTPGRISMSGSATTVRWLLANDLLDELELMIHPVAVGRGQRLFEGDQSHRLTVVRGEVFDNGVLDVVYAPARG
ncbi:MAG: pyrimidine reductase [Frankiales bacterium]|jgi:dihydrofolate reductase|nr:pyrimidine reductase [Frankiales bacterium]